MPWARDVLLDSDFFSWNFMQANLHYRDLVLQWNLPNISIKDLEKMRSDMVEEVGTMITSISEPDLQALPTSDY